VPDGFRSRRSRVGCALDVRLTVPKATTNGVGVYHDTVAKRRPFMFVNEGHVKSSNGPR